MKQIRQQKIEEEHAKRVQSAPDFNPENDKQAQDRCHRIGQERQVTVYKLVCMNSVDEDIFNMGERKSKLSNAILQNDTKSKAKKAGGKKSNSDDADTTTDLTEKEENDEEDIGAIGWILQKALQRVQKR